MITGLVKMADPDEERSGSDADTGISGLLKSGFFTLFG